MAVIEERKTPSGKKSYRVRIRLKGLPHVSETFATKTDAKIWAQKTEAAMLQGLYFPEQHSQKHTVAEIIDRYVADLHLRNPRRYIDVRHMLSWWKERIGPLMIGSVTSEHILKSQHTLQGLKSRRRDAFPALAISIDNFLDAHRDDTHMNLCGKLAIVSTILQAEAKSKLASPTRVQNINVSNMVGTWYARFFQMLTENVDKASAHNLFDEVAIICFNYDRCIERFLVQAVRTYYGFSLDEATAIVSKLEVYHPYGTVGPLPWQAGEPKINFGSKTAEGLLSLAGRIKTFTDRMDDENLLYRIQEEIFLADTIVFLGFAFHPTNMQLLTPKVETKTRRVFATTFGLSPSDEQVIKDSISLMMGKLGSFTGNEVDIVLANEKCQDFFRQYFRSLSAAN